MNDAAGRGTVRMIGRRGDAAIEIREGVFSVVDAVTVTAEMVETLGGPRVTDEPPFRVADVVEGLLDRPGLRVIRKGDDQYLAVAVVACQLTDEQARVRLGIQ